MRVCLPKCPETLGFRRSALVLVVNIEEHREQQHGTLDHLLNVDTDAVIAAGQQPRQPAKKTLKPL